jgi:hypothetical protein
MIFLVDEKHVLLFSRTILVSNYCLADTSRLSEHDVYLMFSFHVFFISHCTALQFYVCKVMLNESVIIVKNRRMDEK